MIYRDVIIVLAIWRISRLFVIDDWPFLLMARFRTWIGVYDVQSEQSYSLRGFLVGLLNCTDCFSLWVSAAIVICLYVMNEPMDYAVLRVFAYAAITPIINQGIIRYAG